MKNVDFDYAGADRGADGTDRYCGRGNESNDGSGERRQEMTDGSLERETNLNQRKEVNEMLWIILMRRVPPWLR